MRMNRLVVGVLLALLASMIAACGGGSAAPAGDTGEPAVAPEEPTAVPTLSAEGVQGKLYVGEVLPPASGPVGLYVRTDNSIEMIMATEDVTTSLHMNGQLEGQRVNLQSEVGGIRATGRVERDGIEINITMPGKGYLRVELKEATEGSGLYQGEFNGLTAGLVVLANGTILGFAPVEDGDEPVYERLCVEGGESLPDTITARTCDTDQEVVLNLVTD